ncbi:MAG: hypothetical protein ACJ8F5_00230 [Bacillales bacterium]
MAALLNVSQIKLETEFYMVDILAVLEQKRKLDAVNRLQTVQALLATNNRAMEDSESKSFMRELTKALGVKEEKFSRAKFEELRRFTEMGG